MANVKAIIGFNSRANSTNYLLACYGNDVLNVDNQTEEYRAGFRRIRSNVELVQFLDSIFLLCHDFTDNTLNFPQRPLTLSYNTSGAGQLEWGVKNVQSCPWAKFGYPYKGRMYFLNCYIPVSGVRFRDKLFYSELPDDKRIQWGFDWGKVAVTKGNNIAFSTPGAGGTIGPYSNGFKRYKIKIGDPIFFYGTGDDDVVIQNTVLSVDSDLQLHLVNPVDFASGTYYFWVGRNWLDVTSPENDEGMWLTENNSRLLIFKVFSLWQWGGPGTALQQVRGAPGTTASRSVMNVGKKYVVYFFGGSTDTVGFYLHNGNDVSKISGPVQPFMEAIDSAFYDDIVAWREGPLYRAYIGTLTNRVSSNDAYNISMSKAVFTWNSDTGAISIDKIDDAIVAAGYFIESNQEKTFLGNDAGQVFQAGLGNANDTTPIGMALETHVIYPRGSHHFNDHTRLQIWGKDTSGVTVMYKLWNTPFEVDQQWRALGSLKGDMTELTIPNDWSYGAGIQYRFQENSTKENSVAIEKIITWSADRGDIPINRNK